MLISAVSSAMRNCTPVANRITVLDTERMRCPRRAGIASWLIVQFTPAYVVRIFGRPAKLLIYEVSRSPRVYLWLDAPHRVDQQENDNCDDSNGSGVKASSSFRSESHFGPPPRH